MARMPGVGGVCTLDGANPTTGKNCRRIGFGWFE